MELDDYVWKERDGGGYRNMEGDVLYVEDGLDGQTELDDFGDGERYAVKVNRSYNPPSAEDETVDTAETWGEVENILDGYR